MKATSKKTTHCTTFESIQWLVDRDPYIFILYNGILYRIYLYIKPVSLGSIIPNKNAYKVGPDPTIVTNGVSYGPLINGGT